MNIAGKNVPNWAVYGGAGLVVVGGVLWYRKRSGGSSSAAAPATAATDPNAIDPATGIPYADEQAGNYAGYTQGISGYGYGTPTLGGGTSPTGTTFTTNAQWVQAATAGLTALGYNGSDVGAALGLYLLGMPLSADQVTIVQTAVAEFGPPPVGQFAIIASPNSQTGSTGSGSGGTTGTGSGDGGGTGSGGSGGSTPPPASGGPITVTPVDLHVTHTYANSAQVGWIAPRIPSGQGPLTGYGAACYDSNGHLVNGPFTVPPGQLYANFGGLKSKTVYHANVWCDPAKPGGPHASVSFKTT